MKERKRYQVVKIYRNDQRKIVRELPPIVKATLLYCKQWIQEQASTAEPKTCFLSRDHRKAKFFPKKQNPYMFKIQIHRP